MKLQERKEDFGHFLYNNKDRVLSMLRIMRTVASISALVIFILYYGFPHTDTEAELLIRVTKSIFGFFVISYFIRAAFAIDSWRYIIETRFEASLILLLLIDVVSVFIFKVNLLENIFTQLDIENFTPLYILAIQSYLLLLVGIEFVKVSTNITGIKLKPASTFIYSFLLLIAFGTGLLMLPEMSIGPENLGFLDALFTAVSATCVTGLTVIETSTQLSFKGHLVLLLLIQLGGIGILTFATFFALFLKKGLGISHQAMVRDFMSEESLFNAKSMLLQVIMYTVIIEGIGTILLFLLWDMKVPFYDDFGEMLFQSVFHSISAFCNAGFSLFSQGLSQDFVRDNYLIHLVIAAMIFFGSLGFPALRDIFSIRNIRSRMASPWKNWKLSTRIALYASIILIGVGALFYVLLEANGTLEGKSGIGFWTTALFQSVATRSAGFNTIDIGAIGTPMIIFFIFLMFIGASSGSTGGGIKTSTFVLIFLAVITTIRGKKNLELGGRSISFDLLNKAFTIFIFSATYILIGTFCLSIFEPNIAILDLVFEEVSAFCTVGLSRGITADLSAPSKVILIISMYIGRIGTLTLAFALASRVDTTNYRYPKAHILVG